MARPRPTTGTGEPGGAVVAVAMGLMNVAMYGLTVVAARLLGPGPYGAFVAMMNVLLAVSVVQLALQATAARRIARAPDHVAAIEQVLLRVTHRAALALGAALLLLAPVVDRLLRLDSLPAALALAVTAVPMTMMGGQTGVLQGERRWHPLAAVYLANGVPKFLLGVAFMAWRPDESTAIAAVAIGQFAPVLVGWWVLRGRRASDVAEAPEPAVARSGRSVLVETARNSRALLAFLALSNADILVARAVLSAHEAGLYAGGLVVAKAMVFVPQFVVVLAFPNLSSSEDRARTLARSLLVVLGFGALAVLGTFALPGLALVFVGGDAYSAIRGTLWAFALAGALMAVVQMLVYAAIARAGTRPLVLVWLALGALVVGGLRATSAVELVTVVVSVSLVLVAALLAVSFGLTARSASADRRATVG